MPAPISHTESSLITLMEDEVGPTGVALGLLETDALLRGVYAIERLLGVAVASVLAADMAKLETIARWQAWRAAKAAAANQFDASLAGGKKFLRSQTWDHIVSSLADAEAEAMAYSEVQTVLAGANSAYVTAIPSTPPYGWTTDEFA